MFLCLFSMFLYLPFHYTDKKTKTFTIGPSKILSKLKKKKKSMLNSITLSVKTLVYKHKTVWYGKEPSGTLWNVYRVDTAHCVGNGRVIFFFYFLKYFLESTQNVRNGMVSSFLSYDPPFRFLLVFITLFLLWSMYSKKVRESISSFLSFGAEPPPPLFCNAQLGSIFLLLKVSLIKCDKHT